MPLVIAVLSARNHFELRRAIRDTWLGQIQTSQKLKNRVVVKFILGSHDCPYRPVDRIHDCLPRLDSAARLPFQSLSHFALKRINKENHQFLSPKQISKASVCGDKNMEIQVDFHVSETIIVDQLGVPNFRHPTRVTLHDYSSKLHVFDTISSYPEQTLNYDQDSPVSLEFIHIPIKPVVLKRGFKGYFMVHFKEEEEEEEEEMIMEEEEEKEAEEN